MVKSFKNPAGWRRENPGTLAGEREITKLVATRWPGIVNSKKLSKPWA